MFSCPQTPGAASGGLASPRHGRANPPGRPAAPAAMRPEPNILITKDH